MDLRRVFLLLVLLHGIHGRPVGIRQLGAQLHLHAAFLRLDLRLGHRVAVAGVAVVANPLLGVGHGVPDQLLAVLGGRRVGRLEGGVHGHAADGRRVARVAVVAPQEFVVVFWSGPLVGGPVQVYFVEQVFVQTRVLVHGVVHVAVAPHLPVEAEGAVGDGRLDRGVRHGERPSCNRQSQRVYFHAVPQSSPPASRLKQQRPRGTGQRSFRNRSGE